MQDSRCRVADIINLGLYPLDDVTTPGFKALVARVRDDLAQKGACQLENFLSEKGLELLVKQARELAPQAYRGPKESSPYFFNYQTEDLEEFPENHPLKRKTPRKLSQVAGDLIPNDHGLKRLHQSPLMTRFLRWVLGSPGVYPGADRHQALNISVMTKGGCQQWHFDKSPMVTTLMLQPPEKGGEFQYVPNVRSDQDENYGRVQEIMDGDLSDVTTIPLKAGTLQLFRGHYALHRVTEVEGDTPRLLAILAYNTKPNVLGSLESSVLHYGDRVLKDQRLSGAGA